MSASVSATALRTPSIAHSAYMQHTQQTQHTQAPSSTNLHHQSNDISQLFCRISTFSFQQLCHPRAQSFHDHSREISHLLPAERKFRLQIDVTAAINRVASKNVLREALDVLTLIRRDAPTQVYGDSVR